MTSWVDVLDAFERSLDWHQELIDDAVDRENPWRTPAAGIGPIPDELRSRAEHLLRRSGDMGAAVEAAMAAMPSATTHQRRTRPGQHHSSTFSTEL